MNDLFLQLSKEIKKNPYVNDVSQTNVTLSHQFNGPGELYFLETYEKLYSTILRCDNERLEDYVKDTKSRDGPSEIRISNSSGQLHSSPF
ncbi:hypothetical protein MAR_002562 [Mya arenaria]|uniref:Uncharacterized protein n=1 Tax=Mya arenaria TaxID=6604 RepID=A0ABY7G649_MYAAR|nr:hypothetical protein MAR_002562 [Mya arenaria]